MGTSAFDSAWNGSVPQAGGRPSAFDSAWGGETEPANVRAARIAAVKGRIQDAADNQIGPTETAYRSMVSGATGVGKSLLRGTGQIVGNLGDTMGSTALSGAGGLADRLAAKIGRWQAGVTPTPDEQASGPRLPEVLNAIAPGVRLATGGTVDLTSVDPQIGGAPILSPLGETAGEFAGQAALGEAATKLVNPLVQGVTRAAQLAAQRGTGALRHIAGAVGPAVPEGTSAVSEGAKAFARSIVPNVAANTAAFAPLAKDDPFNPMGIAMATLGSLGDANAAAQGVTGPTKRAAAAAVRARVEAAKAEAAKAAQLAEAQKAPIATSTETGKPVLVRAGASTRIPAGEEAEARIAAAAPQAPPRKTNDDAPYSVAELRTKIEAARTKAQGPVVPAATESFPEGAASGNQLLRSEDVKGDRPWMRFTTRRPGGVGADPSKVSRPMADDAPITTDETRQMSDLLDSIYKYSRVEPKAAEPATVEAYPEGYNTKSGATARRVSDERAAALEQDAVDRINATAAERTPASPPKSEDKLPYPRAGETVDGRSIGTEVKNTSSISASLGSDYTELPGIRDVPMDHLSSRGARDYAAADDQERVHRLAAEIKQTGRVDPLIVAVDEQGPYVLEGGHRLSALKELGAQSFPAVVVEEPGARYIPTTGSPAAVRVTSTPVGDVASAGRDLNTPPRTPAGAPRVPVARGVEPAQGLHAGEEGTVSFGTNKELPATPPAARQTAVDRSRAETPEETLDYSARNHRVISGNEPPLRQATGTKKLYKDLSKHGDQTLMDEYARLHKEQQQNKSWVWDFYENDGWARYKDYPDQDLTEVLAREGEDAQNLRDELTKAEKATQQSEPELAHLEEELRRRKIDPTEILMKDPTAGDYPAEWDSPMDGGGEGRSRDDGGGTLREPLPAGEAKDVPSDELYNTKKSGVRTPEAILEQARAMAEAKAAGVDKTRVSIKEQEAQARAELSDILRNGLEDADPSKLQRMSGGEIMALRGKLDTNLEQVAAISKALADPSVTPEDAAQFKDILDGLRAENSDLISTVVRESSQKGRDLNFMRQLARISTDPAVWLVHAERQLQKIGRSLSDDMESEIIKLTRAAKEACGG